ncbi:hypothetical protein MRX96_002397 [Rhipicephalus microplus]
MTPIRHHVRSGTGVYHAVCEARPGRVPRELHQRQRRRLRWLGWLHLHQKAGRVGGTLYWLTAFMARSAVPSVAAAYVFRKDAVEYYIGCMRPEADTR